MKYFLLYFILGIIFFQSCDNQNTEGGSSTEIIQSEIKDAKSTDAPDKQYSEHFYHQLTKQEDFREAVIKDGQILLTPTDTVQFPEQPPLGETIELEGRNDDHHIKLSVTRINYTTINYRGEILPKGQKTACLLNGNADLGAFFFLGSESDTNELTGESYLSTEFSNANESCSTSIRIGQTGQGESWNYLAKITYECLEKCVTVELGDCPVLIER